MHRIACLTLVFLAGAAGAALSPIAGGMAQEVGGQVSGAGSRTDLSLTIYNDDLALVRDTRSVDLPKGRTRLAFEEVAAKIKAPTALLTGQGVRLVEQNFDYDLLTPQKLLAKAVGQNVRIIRTNPATGEETAMTAEVLAANNGAVLRVGDRIETFDGANLPGRIVFDAIPGTLRARPTLSMTLSAAKAGNRPLKLSYLTEGMSWSADYVGVLSDDESRMALQGLVTLTNKSGTTFRNATLQLVAGDVQQVRQTPDVRPLQAREMIATAPAQAKREALLDYHLYTLPEATTLADRQTKQVGFLSAPAVAVEKRYERRFMGLSTLSDPLPATVSLSFDNSDEAGLGRPLPAGILRLYADDSQGRGQFVGEDRIDHTPTGRTVDATLGQAFDVAVESTTIERETISQSRDRRVIEVTHRYTVKNAKNAPVEVAIDQHLPGDWTILEENRDHRRVSAARLRWVVPAPANGQGDLTIKVRINQ